MISHISFNDMYVCETLIQWRRRDSQSGAWVPNECEYSIFWNHALLDDVAARVLMKLKKNTHQLANKLEADTSRCPGNDI